MIEHEYATVEHTIEKIRKNQWFIWKGRPKVLDEREAIAGPFSKRHEVLRAAVELSMKEELDGNHAHQDPDGSLHS